MDFRRVQEGKLSLYAKVERANGTVEYFKVDNGEHIPVTEKEYKENN